MSYFYLISFLFLYFYFPQPTDLSTNLISYLYLFSLRNVLSVPRSLRVAHDDASKLYWLTYIYIYMTQGKKQTKITYCHSSIYTDWQTILKLDQLRIWQPHSKIPIAHFPLILPLISSKILFCHKFFSHLFFILLSYKCIWSSSIS